MGGATGDKLGLQNLRTDFAHSKFEISLESFAFAYSPSISVPIGEEIYLWYHCTDCLCSMFYIYIYLKLGKLEYVDFFSGSRRLDIKLNWCETLQYIQDINDECCGCGYESIWLNLKDPVLDAATKFCSLFMNRQWINKTQWWNEHIREGCALLKVYSVLKKGGKTTETEEEQWLKLKGV